jgi:hypothetical protein
LIEGKRRMILDARVREWDILCLIITHPLQVWLLGSREILIGENNRKSRRRDGSFSVSLLRRTCRTFGSTNSLQNDPIYNNLDCWQLPVGEVKRLSYEEEKEEGHRVRRRSWEDSHDVVDPNEHFLLSIFSHLQITFTISNKPRTEKVLVKIARATSAVLPQLNQAAVHKHFLLDVRWTDSTVLILFQCAEQSISATLCHRKRLCWVGSFLRFQLLSFLNLSEGEISFSNPSFSRGVFEEVLFGLVSAWKPFDQKPDCALMVNGNLVKLIRCIWNMKEDILSRFGKVAANPISSFSLKVIKSSDGN